MRMTEHQQGFGIKEIALALLLYVKQLEGRSLSKAGHP